MAYKVVITPFAKHQLEMHIAYAVGSLKNGQAAKAILVDAKQTKERLSHVAGSLALCENEILAKYEYRRIPFASHKFFMVYRMEKNMVIVDAIYHELQDYESVFVRKMDLR